MKLQIISQGTPETTRIVDENGNQLEGVVHIDWKIGIDSYARATIELDGVPVILESKNNTVIRL